MKILPVSEFVEIVNGILRETLSGGEEFCVEGEVSGYRVSQGQWVSFDLKDEKSLVNIFMTVWNLNVPIEDGMRIRVFGLPRVYPKYGKFSISADRVELAGEGALKKALALLRIKLEQEGLFDPSRKRPLPRFPQRIALIASRESAAYGDFIRVLGERWGGIDIDLYHVLVQGERAAKDIVSAIAQTQDEQYDAIILTRGGGSLEELMPFNDERVVRAIHASRIPTLVAIGHERDITFAEEAADVRGSTPTDCARRLVPDRRDVLFELQSMVVSIEDALMSEVEEYQAIIDRSISAPSVWLAKTRGQLETWIGACDGRITQWIAGFTDTLQAQMRLLTSLDPKSVLARGYAMLVDRQGKSVRSVSQLRAGDPISFVIRDGEASATVTHVGKRIGQPKLL